MNYMTLDQDQKLWKCLSVAIYDSRSTFKDKIIRQCSLHFYMSMTMHVLFGEYEYKGT